MSALPSTLDIADDVVRQAVGLPTGSRVVAATSA
jgi:hypothetical protein